MERRAAGTIKDASKWVAAAAAPLSVMLPLFVQHIEKESALERELAILQEQGKSTASRLEGHITDITKHLNFDGNRFTDGSMHAAVLQTIRSETDKFIDRIELEQELSKFASRNGLKK